MSFSVFVFVMFCSLFPSLQVKGQAVDDFIVESQDRSKNAHLKSMQAAYASWEENLRADQVTFESQKIMTLSCTSTA